MADEKKDVSAGSYTDSPTSDAGLDEKYTMKQHWKCLAACTLVSMCPFQYGVDFGLIGGLQAMVGFLRVRFPVDSPEIDSPLILGADNRSLATRTPVSPADGTSRPTASSSSRRS